MPYALLQEVFGIIVRLPLHILGHGKADRAGISRIRKHTHRVDTGCHKLFGSYDSVKIMANAFKSVRNGSAVVIKELSLLQNGVRLSAGECVARQHEQRYSVCRCAAAGSYHIRCAGSY